MRASFDYTRHVSVLKGRGGLATAISHIFGHISIGIGLTKTFVYASCQKVGTPIWEVGRSLLILLEDLGLITSISMVAHNHLKLQSQGS